MNPPAPVLLSCAGSKATKVFDEIHAPDVLEELPQEKLKGVLGEASPNVPASPPMPSKCGIIAPPATILAATPAQATLPGPQVIDDPTPPPLETLISAACFKAVSKNALAPKT